MGSVSLQADASCSVFPEANSRGRRRLFGRAAALRPSSAARPGSFGRVGRATRDFKLTRRTPARGGPCTGARRRRTATGLQGRPGVCGRTLKSPPGPDLFALAHLKNRSDGCACGRWLFPAFPITRRAGPPDAPLSKPSDSCRFTPPKRIRRQARRMKAARNPAASASIAAIRQTSPCLSGAASAAVWLRARRPRDGRAPAALAHSSGQAVGKSGLAGTGNRPARTSRSPALRGNRVRSCSRLDAGMQAAIMMRESACSLSRR